MNVSLPHLRVIQNYDPVSPDDLREIVREAVSRSLQAPCYLETRVGAALHYLFLREGQIYSAGRWADGEVCETSIKDYFLATGERPSLAVACCEMNSKLLHSVLVVFQKHPRLTFLTSLVDLDQVLDKLEEEGKSCIVCARQGSFVSALRYEKGAVTALCHGLSSPVPRETTFREEFLVTIYTLSAEVPLEISIFEDLLVRYASDAKMIEPGYSGDLIELYLSKPPIATLFFKGRAMGHWALDKPVSNIGRTEENDIVIDNLAVSRLHAVIERERGTYYIRDCDSLNGTLLNGNRVGRARLAPGDEIVIGKHTLKIQKPTGINLATKSNHVPFDRTVVMAPTQKPESVSNGMEQGEEEPRRVPRLIDKAGDIIVEISKPSLVIGSDSEADIPLAGFLVAKQHAEIVHENGGYRIRHLHGLRRVSVGGKAIKECWLKDKDQIRIGNREFIFQE